MFLKVCRMTYFSLRSGDLGVWLLLIPVNTMSAHLVSADEIEALSCLACCFRQGLGLLSVCLPRGGIMVNPPDQAQAWNIQPSMFLLGPTDKVIQISEYLRLSEQHPLAGCSIPCLEW
jgi:hypothetical protein